MNSKTKISSFIFVCIVLWGFIGLEFIRSLQLMDFHWHQVTHSTCTDKLEKDPCHLRVVHFDTVNGCKHKSHVAPESNYDFDISIFHKSNKFYFEHPTQNLNLFLHFRTISYVDVLFTKEYIGLSCPRGPPFQV